MTQFDEHAAPEDFYLQIVSGFRLSRALWVAAHFRLADFVTNAPATVEEIAAATGAQPNMLSRLLDALVASGFFAATGDGRIGLTPASDLMRSDHPQSQRALIEVLLGGPHFDAWGELATTLRTGQAAFEAHHGMSWIDYYAVHPEAGQSFADAMTATTHAFEPTILATNPFPAFDLAVDVGGSYGSLLRGLLARQPGAKGIVFDLPEVINYWRRHSFDDLDGRLRGVAGNFFQSMPAGADLYLLKWILHDWDDERAVAILKQVQRAMAPDGHVAIVECVLPASPVPHVGWAMDLNMMVITGGHERSEAAFATLLAQAGLHLVQVVHTGCPLSVIVANRLQ